jgi:hypothetical protein
MRSRILDPCSDGPRRQLQLPHGADAGPAPAHAPSLRQEPPVVSQAVLEGFGCMGCGSVHLGPIDELPGGSALPGAGFCGCGALQRLLFGARVRDPAGGRLGTVLTVEDGRWLRGVATGEEGLWSTRGCEKKKK